MGLIVNRPSGVPVCKALAGHFDLPESSYQVFVGGPVEEAALFILHNSREQDSAARSVAPGVYMGSSPQAFESVIRAASEDESAVKFRVMCGCAGWGPGQLEGELRRADWYLLPATAELVFETDPYQLWDDLHRRSQAEHRLLPAMQGNPELN
jgi:putative transcriptional regulator